MNIQEAKEQIKRSVSIYLMKDEFGNYRVPLEQQRPVFMLGAPGIGKTAIVSQIARELGVSLVSYSMTHHTRQSALGLPFIEKKVYQGEEYEVSLYTLSEIIASVYENMEKSGQKEGILFLDEINCVSETLGPSMLQFLQYKTFGNHKLPEGWIVVTAGNPQEYNRSARTFDVATLDRLKVMNIEPDYEIWTDYAKSHDIHRSILSFLDIHEDDFYHIETTVDGRNYVTARGWEDLSTAIRLYEESGYPVDETLISQYLHDDRISGDFAVFYELYSSYRKEYQIKNILRGTAPKDNAERMKNASFDEKASVTALLLDSLFPRIRLNVETERALRELRDPLRRIKNDHRDVKEGLIATIGALNDRMQLMDSASGLDEAERRNFEYQIAFLNKAIRAMEINKDPSFQTAANEYASLVSTMKQEGQYIEDELENMFDFLEENGDTSMLMIAVTQITADHYASRFVASHDSEGFYRNSDALLSGERNAQLMQDLKEYRDACKRETLQL